MADNQPNKSGKRELTMEQRLLLAFVLMGLVLFLMPYFYKAPPPAPKTSATLPGKSTVTPATPATATAAAQPATQSTEPVPGQIVASSEQQFDVDTDIYHITLSN